MAMLAAVLAASSSCGSGGGRPRAREAGDGATGAAVESGVPAASTGAGAPSAEAGSDALSAGLTCLETSSSGPPPWPTWVRWEDGGAWQPLYSVFTVAAVVSGLAELPRTPRVVALAERGLEALEADRNDDGTWCFYGRLDRVGARPGMAWEITADADDTARAALALRAWARPVGGANSEALARQVEPDGSVRTWFAPPERQVNTDTNRVDPVVAAAVMRALVGTGHEAEVARIRGYLEAVRAAGIPEETTYYAGRAFIGHEIDVALGLASPADPVAGWPTGRQGADGCWPLQASFYGASEAGRPAYGSVAEPTVAGLVRGAVRR